MELVCEPVASWPRLAWLARFRPDGDALLLQHGCAVETGDDWFAEAVWDGLFTEANFDQTDLVFGSGGRRRGNRWVFVSSGATVDRLHSARRDDEILVSNSLACLTAALDAAVDPHARNYFRFFESIIRGLGDYRQVLPTSAGDVRLTYFNNLAYEKGRLNEVEKPLPPRDFSTFEGYETFLIDAMHAIGDNLSSPARTSPLSPIASVSTGYDSPTVAAIARHAGLQETISIIDARGGANDDGSEIARRLGLRPVNISRDAWHSGNANSIDLTRFIASDAKGEDVYFASAGDALAGRVLFTGFGGSRMWDKSDDDYSRIRRGDQSGLSLAEARLHCRCIHVPLPFFAALRDNDVRAIGRCEEMQQWSVGGDYDRPICRRIVEQAGVPRELFGQSKKAASVLLFDRESFLPPEARESFRAWLVKHRVGKRTKLERLTSTARDAFLRHGASCLGSAQQFLRRLPASKTAPMLGRLTTSGRVAMMARYEPQFAHIFPWALEATQQAYRLDVSRRR